MMFVVVVVVVVVVEEVFLSVQSLGSGTLEAISGILRERNSSVSQEIYTLYSATPSPPHLAPALD